MLKVKGSAGRYRNATRSEILDAAASIKRREFVGVSISDPKTAGLHAADTLRGRDSEAFAVIFVDNRHRVISSEVMFEGTIERCSVYPREIIKRALDLNAAAIILAHNHPSGVAEPSTAEENITRRLNDAAALVDIRVLDHIVVGDGETVSLAARGII